MNFMNPYVMVPTPSRDVGDPVWGDGPGPGHDRARPDLISGTVPITLTVETPLLLLEPGGGDGEEAAPVRLGPDGRPYLPWTSLKGALRSSFEALTNSRYGVFGEEWDLPLALRRRASTGLYPGRVDLSRGHTESVVRVTTALTLDNLPPPPGGDDWTPSVDLVPPDVWVPMHHGQHFQRPPGIHSAAFGHGIEVEGWVHLMVHRRVGRQSAFWLWRVSDLVPASQAHRLPAHPSPAVGGANYRDVGCAIRVRGHLILGGPSFGRRHNRHKHDERLFVTTVVDPNGQSIDFYSDEWDVTQDVARGWTAVIESYTRAAEESPSPFPPARHVTHGGEERVLRDGQLCFVEFDDNDDVKALFPVLISRQSYPSSPRDLLDRSLRPAGHVGEMSPADRVFGWARSRQRSGRDRSVDSYRGHIQAGQVGCTTENWEALFRHTVYLTPLNSPKPEQFRFYLHTGDGQPLPTRLPREAANGYSADAIGGRQLARKFYRPHTGLPEDYWRTGPLTEHGDTQTVGYDAQRSGDRWREFLAPLGTRRGVSKRIRGWVEPGTTFSVTLRLDNIQPLHLGALLWLLIRGPGNLSLGAGKPLGFGLATSRVDWKDARLQYGGAVASTYTTWDGPQPLIPPDELREIIKTAIRDPHLAPQAAQLEAIRKTPATMPVHYPRRAQQGEQAPPPRPTSYEWFVENERVAGGQPVHGYALPLANSEDPGLPYV